METGETYAMFWERHDVAERRQLLREAGARAVVAKGRAGGGTERRKGPDGKRSTLTAGVHTAPAVVEPEGTDPDEL
ncbi:hypothetical protein PWG71_11570 [Nocardiopsis sp. N85]|uniref:hypothetical protein n=1 Tax=Nocardiopsis sp. N85 TaxID=3029400 RepID=UPI00237EF779|nr:hypothetical protein [Nocardiopsis sp. N85]MDE3722030.1 hypothetical protein [Nocardiopsis sp. N85]